jgi:phosphomannomutase/phosphoglucomutase
VSSGNNSEPKVFGKYDIRGSVPEELDSKIVFGVARSLGEFYGEGRVLVGRDHRESSRIFSEAMKSGLASQGLEVVDVGLATTDAVAWKASEGDHVGGVVLTASHMPPEFGGIKPLNHEGRILTNEEQDKVKERYGDQEDCQAYGEVSETDISEEYISSAIRQVEGLVGEANVKVVVDPGNGVGGLYLPEILRSLGAEVKMINAEPDPEFPNRSPEPCKENIDNLSSAVKQVDADLGVALDGDADRAVFVDEEGEFVSGEQSLAILSRLYSKSGVDEIVVSVDAGLVVRDAIKPKGGNIRQVPPGAVFTALECQDGAGFGGQPNGHLMDPDFVPYDSGTFPGAIMAGLASNESLSSRKRNLPDYNEEKLNYETNSKQDVARGAAIGLTDEGWSFTEKKGAYVGTKDRQRLLLRPSGSEPVIRVSLQSENPDLDTVKESLRNADSVPTS